VIKIERPLGLSEILAETVRLYGDRFAAGIGPGSLSPEFSLQPL
jgi:hypothetical protein